MENKITEKRGTCWVGYKQVGMKKKGDRMVPNCVKEIYYEENGKGYGYTFEFYGENLQEAEYKGRKVKLNKIMQGDKKKFKVYVKNDKGNVVVVHFGQGGDAKGGTMRIRKSNPKGFSQKAHCAGKKKKSENVMKLTKSKLKEMIEEEYFNYLVEKNVPTQPAKWSYYKSQAKKKFDVYPSAYANAWAAKQYKKAGGGWKKGK